MAVVTSDLLQSLTTNFRALFEDNFAAAQAQMIRSLLATEVDSNTAEESYNWLGTVPKMREWLGERVMQGLSAHTYTIKNKHYEATLEVDRDTIEDDRLGIIRPRLQQLALEAARFQDELAITTLAAGASNLTYDGQYFFDTDHAEADSGTQSNKLTGTGVTLTALRTDYEAARAAMLQFKDGHGRPMSIQPTHVLAPPALEGAFRQLLNSEIYIAASGGVAAGVSNVWRGTADLIISPYLTDANDWYLLSLNQPVKPLIFQNRRAIEFVALDNPNDEQAFLRRRFYYGVDGRFNVGYAMWQFAVLTTN